MKKITLALCVCGLLATFLIGLTYRDELTYRLDWYIAAKKPTWWNNVNLPKQPPITTTGELYHFTSNTLTVPCCNFNTDKYRLERKIASKGAYAVVMENFKNPYVAAKASGYVSTNMTTGWNRIKILEFYMKYFYWSDYSHCSDCMVGDLTWFRIDDLSHLYHTEGRTKESLSLILKYLDDRGHELHARYRIKAQMKIATYKRMFGDSDQAIKGLDVFLKNILKEVNPSNGYYIEAQVHTADLKDEVGKTKEAAADLSTFIKKIEGDVNLYEPLYYVKRLLNTCKRLKGESCLPPEKPPNS